MMPIHPLSPLRNERSDPKYPSQIWMGPRQGAMVGFVNRSIIEREPTVVEKDQPHRKGPKKVTSVQSD